MCGLNVEIFKRWVIGIEKWNQVKTVSSYPAQPYWEHCHYPHYLLYIGGGRHMYFCFVRGTKPMPMYLSDVKILMDKFYRDHNISCNKYLGL